MVHGAPIAEGALRARATKPLALCFARVDEQLKVDRAPIRALATVAAEAREPFIRLLSRLPNRAVSAPGPRPGCPVREPGPAPKRPPPLGWCTEG